MFLLQPQDSVISLSMTFRDVTRSVVIGVFDLLEKFFEECTGYCQPCLFCLDCLSSVACLTKEDVKFMLEYMYTSQNKLQDDSLECFLFIQSFVIAKKQYELWVDRKLTIGFCQSILVDNWPYTWWDCSHHIYKNWSIKVEGEEFLLNFHTSQVLAFFCHHLVLTMPGSDW